MLIDTSRVLEAKTWDIQGSEAWINAVIETLPGYRSDANHTQPKPQITGNVSLRPGYNDVIELVVKLKMTDYVPCAVCQDPKSFEIDDHFELWLTRSTAEKLDAMSADDLDQVYLRNGSLDVIEVLSDRLHELLPSARAAEKPGDYCPLCQTQPSAAESLGSLRDNQP